MGKKAGKNECEREKGAARQQKNYSLYPKMVGEAEQRATTTLAIYYFTSSLNTFIRLKCFRQKK